MGNPSLRLSEVLYKVKMNAVAIRTLSYDKCVCMGDNPLAKAHGLSSITDAQPYIKVHLN